MVVTYRSVLVLSSLAISRNPNLIPICQNTSETFITLCNASLTSKMSLPLSSMCKVQFFPIHMACVPLVKFRHKTYMARSENDSDSWFETG